MPNELPLTVAEWPRDEHRTVLMRLAKFKGQPVLECRAWSTSASGELRPAEGSLMLPMKHLPAVAAALQTALKQARDLGLLAEGVSS